MKVLEYKLSDLFIIREEHPDLELVVRIININPGEDEGILERCKTLREYAWFVETVRKHLREKGLAEALPQAVDECIAKGILRDFLIRHKAQVIKMSIYEFNQEQLRKWDQEEGLEKGRKEGDLFRLLTLIQRKIKKGKCLSQIADELEEEESVISRGYEAVLAAGEDVSIDEIVQKLLTKA